MVTALPSNGTILLAGGVKPVTLGETLDGTAADGAKVQADTEPVWSELKLRLIEVGLNSAKSCC